ncbi:type II toxin-antitoxin system HicB family antitoxin [bacterium]|nr:type II toxin-antitoxin system HicB family antitoxin [bacterium]
MSAWRHPDAFQTTGIGSPIMQLTAVFVETGDGYLAFVEELQNLSTRGTTLEEARTRLYDVIHEQFEQNRELAEGTLSLSHLPFRKEPLILANA